MPRTGEICEFGGNFIDDHLHEARVAEGSVFPSCPYGDTQWWHEDLPVAKQLRHEAQRPPRPGGQDTW